MKTTFKNLLTVAMLFAAITYANAQQEQADAYDSDSLAQINSIKNDNRNTSVTSVILGDNPIPLADSSIFEYNLFNTDVTQSNVTYMYYPKTDSIVMVLNSALSKYYIFFDKNDRSVLRAAYKQYLQDFSNHVLDKTSNKTYNSYGEFAGEYRMGMIGTATITKPKVSVGYKFVKKSPYFSLTLWPAELESFMPDADAETSAGSDKMTFFLTKKQAADFVNTLDEEKIQSLIATTQVKQTTEKDEY